MYESYYRLDRRPFLATPDPDCFVTLDSAQKALSELGSCIENGWGIGVLSAEPGTGKTLLCRKLIVDLRNEFAPVFLANSNFSNRRALLQAILYELGHPYVRMGEQELRLELKTAVNRIRPQKQAVLLIVDEAHDLDNRLLEEIRTATSLVTDGIPLVRVILSGQTALEERLVAAELDAINQRLACHVTLERLTRRESADYIAHRLQWAGGRAGEIFQPDALEMICHVSDGLPRCLNQLCDHALLLAYVAGENRVSTTTVTEALEDLRQLPLHWNEPVVLDRPVESAASESAQPHEAATSGEVPGQQPAETGHSACLEVGAANEQPAATEPRGPVEALPEDGSCVIEVGSDDRDEMAVTGGLGLDGRRRENWEEPDEQKAVSSLRPGFSSSPRCVAEASPAGESAPSDVPFEEEPIVDRYALLDAGLPLPSESTDAEGPDQRGRLSEKSGPADSQVQPQSPADDDTVQSRANQILDDLGPMLDEALSKGEQRGERDRHSSTIHDHGSPSAETLKAGGETGIELTWDDAELDREQRHPAAEHAPDEQAASASQGDPTHTETGPEEHSETDRIDSETIQQTAAPGPRTEPRTGGRYSRLFTKLKRRQRAGYSLSE